MSAGKPLVSVCIPSYNHARFLAEAIESVLAQTYRPLELVIADDGSTDNSLQIAAAYAAKHPGLVRLYTHPNHVNRGTAATLNLGTSHCTGDYWSAIASDDAYYPDMLERQVAFLEAHPELGWVYAPVDRMGAHGEALAGRWGQDVTRHADPLAYLILANPIPAMSVLARSSSFKDVGPYDESLRFEDWDMWLRMLARYKVGFLNEPAGRYRIHTANVSLGAGAAKTNERIARLMLAWRKKAVAVGGPLAQPFYRALMDFQAARHQFLQHQLLEAGQSLQSAFNTCPEMFTQPAHLIVCLSSIDGSWKSQSPSSEAFVAWLLDALPSVTGGAVSSDLVQYLSYQRSLLATFARHSASDLAATRQAALRCICRSPRALGDRAFRSVFVESVIGAACMRVLRKIKRSVRS
jgi:GT2 family glycosyltransferase